MKHILSNQLIDCKNKDINPIEFLNNNLSNDDIGLGRPETIYLSLESEKLPIEMAQSFNSVLLLNDKLPIEVKKSYSSGVWDNKILKILTSTILGTGVGFAMMPIFNDEVEHLENYGINVHGNSTFFGISTINTFFATGITTGFFIYNYLCISKQKKEPELNRTQKIALTLCKVASFVSSLIPVGMLWNIELKDQKVEETHGFDKFISWATLTSIPLICFKTLNNFERCSKYITKESDTIELNNLGSKITVYGISSVSLIGRGIAYTYVFDNFQKQIGIDENVSLPISIIMGGMIGNITLGLSEYSNLKKLFKNNIDGSNYKQLFLGISSALEGGWFALPVVSQGLDACNSWNALLKGAIFTPFFLSHMNSESLHLYHSILPEIQVLEEQNDINIDLIGNNVILD